MRGSVLSVQTTYIDAEVRAYWVGMPPRVRTRRARHERRAARIALAVTLAACAAKGARGAHLFLTFEVSTVRANAFAFRRDGRA